MFSQINPYHVLCIYRLKKNVDTMYIFIERLLHNNNNNNTILLHVATIYQAWDSLGRLTHTHRCEVNDTAVV